MASLRLKELYQQKIQKELMKELGCENIFEVPKIEKIVINVGVKEAVADSRVLKKYMDAVALVAGQNPVRTLAKKSIAGFKIREHMPLGVKVTLRGAKMYYFLDKLINLSLPKVKDFQGLNKKLDGHGNYNIGIKEWSIFPEAERVSDDLSSGLNITIQTTASHDQAGFALLKKFGIPFRK